MSPDQQVQIRFALRDASPQSKMAQEGDRDVAFWRVDYRGEAAVDWSRLGLEIGGQGAFAAGFVIEDVQQTQGDQTWQPICGERAQIRDHYNQLTVMLSESIPPGRTIKLIFRAYDQGAAFRYEIPEQPGLDRFVVTAERSCFVFPESTVGYSEYRTEGEYEKKPIDQIGRGCERPLAVAYAAGFYGCLCEAAVDGYSRMLLSNAPRGDGLISDLSGAVQCQAPAVTPWRVLILSDRPGGLVENNDLVRNLNRPCELAETSWIKPGTMLREYTLSTPGAKAAIDWAAPMGFTYLLFDAGWYGPESLETSDPTSVSVDQFKVRQMTGEAEHPGLDLPEVVRYARERGMGVFVYVNHRHLERQLEAVIAAAKQWGVAGLKFGFVHVGPAEWTDWLHQAIRRCAEAGLLVDVHDEYRPTGLERTCPNLLTVEGVRGNEHCPDARHNCTLPFARFTAGPADYTPALLSERIRNTHAHQLALPVIFFSPLQCLFWLGEKPFEQPNRPEYEFWRDMPTTWDETHLPQAGIGEYVVAVRRKGDVWYLGAITNELGRELELPLGFLASGRWQADCYLDDPAAQKPRSGVAVDQRDVESGDVLRLSLLPGGGAAVRFARK